MKEHPILFSGPMVRAILAGRKTQTRRVVKWRPYDEGQAFDFTGIEAGHYATGHPEHGWVLRTRGRGGVWNDLTEPERCRFGQPGDRLWVRETWAIFAPDPAGRPGWRMSGCEEVIAYRADGEMTLPPGVRWRPSIHMPRWASRLSLEVTQVRVERLWAINEDDARAEGVELVDDPRAKCVRMGEAAARPYRYEFRRLWESINGKREGASWSANPWLWVVGFQPLYVGAAEKIRAPGEEKRESGAPR